MLNRQTKPKKQYHAITFTLEGMTCNHCVATIKLAVKPITGVRSVAINLHKHKAHITFAPAETSPHALKKAITHAGYFVVDETEPTAVSETPSLIKRLFSRWKFRVVFFGMLGMLGLAAVYLGLVSWAEGWAHAVELMLEDAWIIGPILGGFGVQVGLYTYLKTVIHTAGRGTGAMAGAGGGTSTVAMVACCAHHVTDVLPLLGLSVAATFLADYRIPFMVFGLITNLIGIGVMATVILKEHNRMRQLLVPATAEMTYH